ncbi:hypothetical protein [Spirochaeta thermophila]|uniref:Lipoprotein n=1 Tax=Winmispira thermophila (strain ATCC 49972 / DSM 6192 / RI 19.B1) TaxID=665571 RepID=E0RU29_WINT6|nr:hypothetical protein [Spirochaeta thermophila]ADN01085.1 hypothetical protein STHERM_c01090 [Spirochaeta thermophila DSM 6192]
MVGRARSIAWGLLVSFLLGTACSLFELSRFPFYDRWAEEGVDLGAYLEDFGATPFYEHYEAVFTVSDGPSSRYVVLGIREKNGMRGRLFVMDGSLRIRRVLDAEDVEEPERFYGRPFVDASDKVVFGDYWIDPEGSGDPELIQGGTYLEGKRFWGEEGGSLYNYRLWGDGTDLHIEVCAENWGASTTYTMSFDWDVREGWRVKDRVVLECEKEGERRFLILPFDSYTSWTSPLFDNYPWFPLPFEGYDGAVSVTEEGILVSKWEEDVRIHERYNIEGEFVDSAEMPWDYEVFWAYAPTGDALYVFDPVLKKVFRGPVWW